MVESLGKARRVDCIDAAAARPVCSMLAIGVLLMPFVASTEGRVAPVRKGSNGYNPTSQLQLTIARP